MYIIPLLIKQPTWGGKYIAQYKKIQDEETLAANIGQAYELAQDSLLIDEPIDLKPGDQLPYQLAEATDLEHPHWFGKKYRTISMPDLIKKNVKDILGEKVAAKMNNQMAVLNKFTQAQENSYQVHVQPDQTFEKWQPKPESWYFFEQGKATLGLKTNANVLAYQNRCTEIYEYSQELSRQVREGELDVAAAREKLEKFINHDHPRHYVNTLELKAGQIVDLSEGGIHHSWEADANFPKGNIVYEVQLDQRDDVSSIRAFDQGKIKDDGSIRQLAIEAYFKALNINADANLPDQYLQSHDSFQDDDGLITHLFDCEHYRLTMIEFDKNYGGLETQLDDEFHHLFVKEGEVEVRYDGRRWLVPAGWSIFIPAGCQQYQLSSTAPAVVLKTTA